MWTFLYSGILYLSGVALILFLRPSMMFTPDGQWKEFGIGQNREKYSPFPFWMFCLVWAIVSYTIVLFITSFSSKSKNVNSVSVKRNMNTASLIQDEDGEELFELPKGYYVLNKKASKIAGVPKYVFIGQQDE
jgi:hypothetical protein